jgi:hypothetical protein
MAGSLGPAQSTRALHSTTLPADGSPDGTIPPNDEENGNEQIHEVDE